MDWNGFSDGAIIYVWAWGNGVDGSWIRCEKGNNSQIIFKAPAGITACIPMRYPGTYTGTGGWSGQWNRGTSDSSKKAEKEQRNTKTESVEEDVEVIEPDTDKTE